MTESTYRVGALGALMDEYERAAAELLRIVGGISDDEFETLRDAATDNEDCRSIQTIMVHVCRASLTYAEYIRVAFELPGERPPAAGPSRLETIAGLEFGLAYTESVLDGHWHMTEDDLLATRIESRWGQVFDVDSMLEHAIVHILRHRRQIERFLGRPRSLTAS